MSATEKRIIQWLAAIAVLSIIAYLVINIAEETAFEGRISVATNLPLSGPLAVYGISIREGVETYLSDNSSAQSALAFDWQDNASDPAAAVRIASRQLEGTAPMPVVYVSGVKPQAMAIASQVNETGIPHFVWIFDPSVRATGAQNFRTWVSYKIEPQAYFEFAERMGARRVAIAYVQLPHTVEEFESIVLPGFRERQIEVFTEVFDYGRTDFREIARKLNDANADVIILNGFQLELASMVRALRQEEGYDPEKIIGTYDMLDAAEVLSPQELEGIKVVAPRFATEEGRNENTEWIRAFTQKWGKPPLYTHAFAYDMAAVIFDAFERTPGDFSPEALTSAIASSELTGITGDIQFDEDGDLITPLVIGVFKGGSVTEWSE